MYIIFTENNMKNFRKTFYYLQCDNNMKAYEDLRKLLEFAKYDSICGAFSEFYLNTTDIIETPINEYKICKGQFILPQFNNCAYDDSNMIGDLLNCYFYNGNIIKYFS